MHGSRPKYVVIDYTDLRPGDKAPEPVELDDLPERPSPQEPLTEAGPSRASPAASSPATRTATPAPTAPASRAPEPKTPIWQRAMRSVQQLLTPRVATGRGAPKAPEPAASPTPSAVEAAAAEKVSKAAKSSPPVRTPPSAAPAPAAAPEPKTKAAPVVDKAPPEAAKPLPPTAKPASKPEPPAPAAKPETKAAPEPPKPLPVLSPLTAVTAPKPEPPAPAAKPEMKGAPEPAKPLPVLLPLSAVAAPKPEPPAPKPELKAAPIVEKVAPEAKSEAKTVPVAEKTAPEPKPEAKAEPIVGKAEPEPEAKPVAKAEPIAEMPAPEPKLDLNAAPVVEKSAPEPEPKPVAKTAPVAEKPAPAPKPEQNAAPVAEQPAPALKPELKAAPAARKAAPESAKPSLAAIEAPAAREKVVPPPVPPVPAASSPPAGSFAAQAEKPRPSSAPQPPAKAEARPSKRTRGKKVLPPRSRPQKPAQVSSSPPAAQAPPAPPTAPAPAFPRSGSANVIALSDNRTLIDVLRDSLAGSHRVWRADDVAHAGELIVSAGNAVFLVDASLPGLDTREFVGSLHGQFPELAIIVVVNRDNEAPLAPLVTSGAIYRCIDAAATAESIRHLIDATQRGPWSAVDRRGGTSRRSFAALIGRARRSIKDAGTKLPKIRISMSWVRRWTGRCLKLGAALAAGWVLWQWKPWTWVGDLLPEPETAPAAVAEAEQPAARLKKLLADAEVALSRNRLVEPPGRNALELYRAALALDPANEMARWGVDSVADRLLDEADEALRARDLPRLASAIDAARSARPDHPRLAEYSASLRREQERVFGPGISAR